MNLPSVSFFAGLVQGGAEKQAVETAKLLHAKGHQVVFYCYNLRKAFYHPEDIIKVVDLKDYHFPLPEIFDKVLSIFRLARIIRREQPDYLITYTTLLNVLNGLIGLLNQGNPRTVFIGSERNSVLRYSNSCLWTILCKLFYHGLAGLFTNNRPALDQLQTIIGLPQTRTQYLANLLDTDYFCKDPAITQDDSGFFTILVPARICDQKNQKILVPVAQLLKQRNRLVQFILAGQPESGYADEFRQNTIQGGVEESFLWLGQQTDIRLLYNRCRLTYLPSKYEGFSNSVMEALACEALVLGSDIPAFTEVIRHTSNGFITSVDDPTAIAVAIEQIMDLDMRQIESVQRHARETALCYGREQYYLKIQKMLKQWQKGGDRI